MARLMKALAGRATRYRNKVEGRTGTLWEGRYKSSPVQTDRYLLACCSYIELNPVRACLAGNPEEYTMSSYRQRMGLNDGDWLDLDPSYLGLADSGEICRHRYARFVREAIPDDELILIRDALQRGQWTGNARFVDEVETILGARIEFRARSRPGNKAVHGK